MTLPVQVQLPVVCARLRSKGAPGVTYDDNVSWAAGFISTATYWCIDAADVVGPDDGFVHPHVCTASRECFRRADPEGEGGSPSEAAR